jgi:hypothetical protein
MGAQSIENRPDLDEFGHQIGQTIPTECGVDSTKVSRFKKKLFVSGFTG